MKNIMLVFSLLGIFVQEGILAQQYTTQELQLCSNESVVNGDAFVEQNNFTASADSRQLVLDTTCYPHSTIVQIIPDNPYFGICSGVLVSYNAVLTSGNCVYNSFFNDTLESATVYPARNGQYLPFDAIKSEEVYVHPSFMFPEINDNFDIGVLILESSFENNLNWMISGEVNTTMPFGIQDIIIQGYAGDIGNNVQFRQECQAVVKFNRKDYLLEHNCFTGIGMAGSPLYLYSEHRDNYQLIGIHSGAVITDFGRVNHATLISNDIVEWITEKTSQT